jgi:Secretion system C-terminal sorting domain
MIKIYFFVVAICLCAILHAQTTVVLNASADNTIYQNFPANSNALGQNFFSGNNGGNSPRRALLKFNIAAVVPTGAVITAVTLTLNCNISRAIADNVSLYKLTTDWGEGTSNAAASGDGAGAAATTSDATWPNNFFSVSNWITAGGDYSATASATTSIPSTGFFTWSATGIIADVQNWLNNPATNFGWILLCNETSAGTARRFASRENATVANRPTLSVTYTTVVPVTLSYFVALQKNNAVQLNWQTEQEINNHYFEILHSTDAVSFSPIAKIFAVGNSSTPKQYQFLHNENLKGYQYYQLVQTDINGIKYISVIIKVKMGEDKFSLKLFPNPASSFIFIKTNINLKNSNYKIYDQLGSIVKVGNGNLSQINLSTFAKGVYYFYLYREDKILCKEKFCIL